MSIKSKIDKTMNLTTHILKGKISADDLRSVLESFFNDRPTENVLWDLREAKSDGKIISNDLEKIARFVKKNQSLSSHGKVALVASSDLAFGLSRTYEAFAQIEGISYSVRVFRSMEGAVKWLETAGEDV
jgi:Ca2+-binding EF-hand superfamily protein